MKRTPADRLARLHAAPRQPRSVVASGARQLPARTSSTTAASFAPRRPSSPLPSGPRGISRRCTRTARRRCRVLPFPVDVDAFGGDWIDERAARARAGHGYRPRVLFMGGDFPRKGGPDLLDAWREGGFAEPRRSRRGDGLAASRRRRFPPARTSSRGVAPYTRSLARAVAARGSVRDAGAARGVRHRVRGGRRERHPGDRQRHQCRFPKSSRTAGPVFSCRRAIAQASSARLRTLVDSSDLRERMGRAARQYVSQPRGGAGVRRQARIDHRKRGDTTMYGNPPETFEWDGVEPEETGLFDDVDVDGERRTRAQAWLDARRDSSNGLRSDRRSCRRCCFFPAARPTGFRFARARTPSACSPLRCGGSIAAGGSAANIRPRRWICCMVLWLGLMMLHPDYRSGSSAWRSWVCISPSCVRCSGRRRTSFNRQQLMRALVVLLVCNGINSVVGVMQVYDPDRWMPRQLSSVYQGQAAT